MNKISIIIPVYNVQKYITQCLESCIRQSLNDIEIICVNDGSTDQSRGKIELLQKDYKNIILINQKNQGTGAARNTGIRRATGKYIVFMDADDCYPDEKALQILFETAEEKQVLICGGSARVEQNGCILPSIEHHPLFKDLLFDQDEMIDYLNYQKYIGFWRFLYNRKFLIDNNIFFPERTENEDPVFMAKALYTSKKFYAIKKTIYQVHRGDHIRVYNNAKSVHEVLEGGRELLEFAKTYELDEIQITYLERTYMSSFSIFMYPFLHDESYLINDVQRVIDEISEKMLLERGRDDLLEKYNVENIKLELTRCQIEMIQLLECVQCEGDTYIYGAGIVAKRITAFLKKEGYFVAGYIVSDAKGNEEAIEGIKVYELDRLNINKNTLILIGALYNNGIKENLIKRGYTNIHTCDFSKMRLFI